MRQKSDISERRILCLQHSCWVTVRLSWVFHTPKMNITFFYRKLDTKYFYVKSFFVENAVFSEEAAKNYSEGTFDHFLGKGGFLGKKLI